MGLFKSLRGKQPEYLGSGASSHADWSEHKRSEQTSHPSNRPSPDKSEQGEYTSPMGPPPSYKAPATFSSEQLSYPEGTLAIKPPPYHDWTAIPDTSSLPPPPSLSNKTSPTGNAEEMEAIRAHRWCAQYPLMEPHAPTPTQVKAALQGQLSLQQPREYKGAVSELSPGSIRCSTNRVNKDCCLLSSLPLYFVMAESPFRTEGPKTVYFEVKIHSFGRSPTRDASSLAIGVCGVPYPTWRMPGWERGSMAVHSDDGRRYINDTDGGIDFTSPFLSGETVGFGVTFSILDPTPGYALPTVTDMPLKGEAFLTRNGTLDKTWNIHEERDSESEFGVLGVDGKYDLFGAVGVFGEVSFDVYFNRRDWLWQPR